MSLEKATMPLTAKQISVMDTNNKFDYNHIVQRGLVWELLRKSRLIESMIIGYPMSNIYCRRDRDDSTPKKTKSNSTYVIMDGKQRLTTVASYIKDSWALSDLPLVTYSTFDGEDAQFDLSGKTFSELPEEIQDLIKDTSFTFVYFENITPEEERELFKRLNAGKPLSTKARVLANCKDLEAILDIGNHRIFQNMMTENALNQKNHVSVIMKIWAMLNKNINEVSFESKYFNPMVEETVISEEEKVQLADIFDYIEDIHEHILSDEQKDSKKIAKKFYTETHLVSFVPSIEAAREDEVDASMFADFVKEFFQRSEEDMREYNEAALRGSARNENIKVRDEIIRKSYNEFFQQD